MHGSSLSGTVPPRFIVSFFLGRTGFAFRNIKASYAGVLQVSPRNMLGGRGWVQPSNSDIRELRAADLVGGQDILVLRDPATGAEIATAIITLSNVVRTNDYRFYSSVGEYAQLCFSASWRIAHNMCLKVGAISA
jgi:hypothetical protein